MVVKLNAMDYDEFLRRYPETYEELKAILTHVGYASSNADEFLKYLIEHGELTRVADERYDDMFNQYYGETTELDFRIALSASKSEQEKNYQISLGELNDSQDIVITLEQLAEDKVLYERIQLSNKIKNYILTFRFNEIQEKNLFQRGIRNFTSLFNNNTKRLEDKVSSIKSGTIPVYDWNTYQQLTLITQPELEVSLIKTYEVNDLISQPNLNTLIFEREFNKIELISKRNIYTNETKSYESYTLPEKSTLETISLKNYEPYTLQTPELQTIETKRYELDVINIKQLQNSLTARMQESDIGVVRVSAGELEQIPIIQVIQDAVEFLDDWIEGKGYYSHSGLNEYFVPPLRLESINQAVTKVGNVRNLAQLSNRMIEIFEEEMNESLTQSIMPGESDREHLDALRAEFGSLLD